MMQAIMMNDPICMYLKSSTLVAKVALPSRIIFSTQLIEVFAELNGAENDASASLKLIPTSAYLMAAQSFAPSPVIQTVRFNF